MQNFSQSNVDVTTLRLALLLITLHLLSACISVTPVTPAQDVNQAWQARVKHLYDQNNWTAQMSLTGVTEQQKFKTRVVWKQQSEHYQIKLRDFIGRTIAVIDGSPAGVVAKTSKGEKFQGQDAETLIYELFGIHIPVTGMRYWLQGLPLPGVNVDQLILSDQGLAESISQQGWSMSYPNYLSHDPFKMPSQVLLEIENIALTVKISQWTFSP